MPSPSNLEHARGTSLDQLLAYHGLLSRKEGSTMRYKNDRFNIVVSDGGLWFDNTASLGGRGAIDLILHVKFGVNPRTASSQQFREAVAWLSNFQPATGVVSKIDLSPCPLDPRRNRLPASVPDMRSGTMRAGRWSAITSSRSDTCRVIWSTISISQATSMQPFR